MSSRTKHLLVEADITPHRSLLPKMGAAGYSFPEAVAELVDNAIEWREPNERVGVAIDVTDDKVVVKDDARGMSAKRLASAMKLGYRDALSEQHTTLSQFGIGMKTACTSLGRRFRVESTTTGTTSRFVVEFDQDEWERGDGFTWRLPVYEHPGKARKEAHGTTITVTKLHYRPTSRVTDLRKDFAQRYATFLENGDAAIRVNTKWVAPERPPVERGTEREFDLPFGEHRVHGWFGLLAEGSQKGYYGWETKRRGRTITMHDKRFGLRGHPEFMKVAGVLHVDFLNVSHDKTAWIEDDTFARLQEHLTEHLRPRVRELVGAEKRARLEARTRVQVARWVGAMTTAAGEEAGTSSEAAPRRKKPTPARPDRVLLRLKREHPPPSAKRGTPADAHPRLPGHRVRQPPTGRVKVGRLHMDVDHRFHPMGVDGPWMEWGVRDDGAIEVFSNEEFPAFRAVEDKAFYAALHIAEALARIVAKEGGGEDADAVKERILRHAATAVLDAGSSPHGAASGA